MSFHEPGNVNELSAALKAKWTEKQSKLFDQGILVAKREASPPSPEAWLFNPVTGSTANTVTEDIKWNALPKRLVVALGSKLAACRESDRTRDNQDEYCEWEVVRNPATNLITRVTFTTETPDYYTFLYEQDKELLLKLYHKYVSPQVELQHLEGLDLAGKKTYMPVNIWNYPEKQNKRGVLLHMANGPNNLAAAVFLSAEATWPSIDKAGKIITDEQGLIICREYGDKGRHSDPHIGAVINGLVRAGNEISFAGPAGLYIDSFDLAGFELPGGADPNSLVRIIRGDKDHMMRIVFEAPEGSNFNLSDVKIDGTKLVFGGQIADKLTIRIRGIAKKAGKKAPTINCRGNVVKAESGIPLFDKPLTRKTSVEFISSAE